MDHEKPFIEADYYRYLAEFLDGDGQKEAESLRISWLLKVFVKMLLVRRALVLAVNLCIGSWPCPNVPSSEAIVSAMEVYTDAVAEARSGVTSPLAGHLFPLSNSACFSKQRIWQAERHLMVTHPIRLGVALNYAVRNLRKKNIKNTINSQQKTNTTVFSPCPSGKFGMLEVFQQVILKDTTAASRTAKVLWIWRSKLFDIDYYPSSEETAIDCDRNSHWLWLNKRLWWFLLRYNWNQEAYVAAVRNLEGMPEARLMQK